MKPSQGELLARWQALGAALERAGPAWTAEGRRLLRHWSRWPRAYHDTRHLHACLLHLEAVQGAQPTALQQPHAVELALWFHDAIYWPWSGHNEERSAQWARRFLLAQRLPEGLVQTVERHIMDTRHNPDAPLEGDACWVVDIDLAVLGAPPEVYGEFERNVRREYRFVRWPRYVAGRSAVLRSFMDRPHVYATPWFRAQREAQARANLQQAVAALGRGVLFGE